MHYLITRFNVDERSWDTQADKDWLDHRWPYFERCLDSVLRAQEEAEFEWILLVHSKTRYGLARINSVRHIANIVFVGRDWLGSLQNWIDKQGHDYIITTRLDSDDLIAPDYMKLVQEQYDRLMPFYFIDAPHGYQWDGKQLYAYSEANNHFCSLVENGGGPFQTVYCTPHGVAMNKWAVRKIPNRQWIEVVHDRNQKNSIKGKPISSEGWPSECDYVS